MGFRDWYKNDFSSPGYQRGIGWALQQMGQSPNMGIGQMLGMLGSSVTQSRQQGIAEELERQRQEAESRDKARMAQLQEDLNRDLLQSRQDERAKKEQEANLLDSPPSAYAGSQQWKALPSSERQRWYDQQARIEAEKRAQDTARQEEQRKIDDVRDVYKDLPPEIDTEEGLRAWVGRSQAQSRTEADLREQGAKAKEDRERALQEMLDKEEERRFEAWKENTSNFASRPDTAQDPGPWRSRYANALEQELGRPLSAKELQVARRAEEAGAPPNEVASLLAAPSASELAPSSSGRGVIGAPAATSPAPEEGSGSSETMETAYPGELVDRGRLSIMSRAREKGLTDEEIEMLAEKAPAGLTYREFSTYMQQLLNSYLRDRGSSRNGPRPSLQYPTAR